MEQFIVARTMMVVGYVILALGIASTWARYGPGHTHRSNPWEAVCQALVSTMLLVHGGLLVFFQPTTIMAALLVGHGLLIWVTNAITMVVVESRREQLGGEYYLHTQITYFVWMLHGLTCAAYMPVAVKILSQSPLDHLPLVRGLSTVHGSLWLLLALWAARTGVMMVFAYLAVKQPPQPDGRYNLDLATRVFNIRTYRER